MLRRGWSGKLQRVFIIIVDLDWWEAWKSWRDAGDSGKSWFLFFFHQNSQKWAVVTGSGEWMKFFEHSTNVKVFQKDEWVSAVSAGTGVQHGDPPGFIRSSCPYPMPHHFTSSVILEKSPYLHSKSPKAWQRKEELGHRLSPSMTCLKWDAWSRFGLEPQMWRTLIFLLSLPFSFNWYHPWKSIYSMPLLLELGIGQIHSRESGDSWGPIAFSELKIQLYSQYAKNIDPEVI